MPTLVQAVKARGTGTSVSISCAATSAGNFLLLVIGEGGALNPTFTVTTPASGFTAEAVVRQNVFNNESGQMFYDQNCAAGITSVTITSSVSMSGCSVWLMEFSGCNTSASPIDVYTSSAPASSSASPSISTTTTVAGDLVVGFIMSDTGNALGTPAQPASPWVSLGAYEQDLAGWESTQGAYQVQTSAGSITYNPTQTVSQDYILWLIAVKPAATATPAGWLPSLWPPAPQALGTPATKALPASPAPAWPKPITRAPSFALATPTGYAFPVASPPAGSIVSGSATLQANAMLAATAAQVVEPSAPVQANAVLAATPDQVVAASDPLTANAVLSETPPALILAPATLAANAGLSVTDAIILAPSDPLQSNAAISETAQLVAHGDALAGNAALATPNGAIVVDPSVPTIGNAVLSASLIAGGGTLTCNAGLSVSAQVVAPAVPLPAQAALTETAPAIVQAPAGALPLPASSVLTEAAQIVAVAFSEQANAVLSATGTAALPSQPGLVTASDRALVGVTAADARAASVTSSDARAATVTTADV